MFAKIYTSTVSGLSERFKGSLYNTSYSLKESAIEGKFVIDHCDCCGHLISKGEKHTRTALGIWCTRCLPSGTNEESKAG